MVHNNYGFVLYRFEDIARKLQFFIFRVFNAPSQGSLGILYLWMGSKLEWWGYHAEKNVWWYLEPRPGSEWEWM